MNAIFVAVEICGEHFRGEAKNIGLFTKFSRMGRHLRVSVSLGIRILSPKSQDIQALITLVFELSRVAYYRVVENPSVFFLQ